MQTDQQITEATLKALVQMLEQHPNATAAEVVAMWKQSTDEFRERYVPGDETPMNG